MSINDRLGGGEGQDIAPLDTAAYLGDLLRLRDAREEDPDPVQRAVLQTLNLVFGKR